MSEKIYTLPWDNYELIDAGGGKKLERFGAITTIRPDLQAYFKSGLSIAQWYEMADFEFIEQSKSKGVWKPLKSIATQDYEWQIEVLDHLTVNLSLTQFKHVGIFPEQAINWNFIADALKPNHRFLNLFAYTGIASVVARSTGAEVTHVDSVKQLVSWAKSNMDSARLSDIKWVVEDALKFAQREVKRGNKYDGIIMDPPAFGLGAKGEKWILEDKLPELLAAAKELLTDHGFLIVNTYSPKLTLEVLETLTLNYFPKSQCSFQELWQKTKTGKNLFYGNLVKVQKVQ